MTKTKAERERKNSTCDSEEKEQARAAEGTYGSSREVSASRTETLKYMSIVQEELRERQEKLVLLDREISTLEFKLKESGLSRSILRGDASSLASSAAWRRSIEFNLKKMQKARGVLVEDIKKALEREEMVKEELNEQPSE